MFKDITIKTERTKPPSVRDIAKVSGVSSATVSRIQNGADYTVSIAKKLLPIMSICPCCGKSTDSGKEPPS